MCDGQSTKPITLYFMLENKDRRLIPNYTAADVKLSPLVSKYDRLSEHYLGWAHTGADTKSWCHLLVSATPIQVKQQSNSHLSWSMGLGAAAPSNRSVVAPICFTRSTKVWKMSDLTFSSLSLNLPIKAVADLG